MSIDGFDFMLGLSVDLHGQKEPNPFQLKFTAHIGPRVEFFILSWKCRRAVKSEILTLKEYEHVKHRTSVKLIKFVDSSHFDPSSRGVNHPASPPHTGYLRLAAQGTAATWFTSEIQPGISQ